ncbi:Twisted gastrulation protein-like 1-A [Holothuria leucospilota]|uniref:Twisted gastrulation protein-like 1-A n=1 Tax=Holothuria leucospilota TaxID=206669 RepID=A0A9Q1CBI2_HOLLE|nr:Twisted gastrulation protein-like 1-A [Holothuria leucospilota]
MKEAVVVGIVVAVVSILYAAIAGSTIVEGCNETQCATDVSKCQLMGACRCTLDNCSCCASCSACLKHLWEPCCPCVGLCKPPNTTHDFSRVSTIGNLEPVPTLFDVLTESARDGSVMQATVYTIPHEEEDIHLYRPPSLDIHALQNNDTSAFPSEPCTVIYIDRCLPLEKCVKSCNSMGASRFRWFHTACCECVGHTCISYGVSESLCKECDSD